MATIFKHFVSLPAVFACCFLFAPVAAHAEEKPFLNIDHIIGMQFNPFGILYEIDPYFRWDFFPGTNNILLRDAFVAAGLTAVLTPSIAYYGPSLTISPLTIFRVNVQFVHTISGVAGAKYGLLNYSENADPELNAELGQFGDYGYEFRDKHGEDLGTVTADMWTLFLKPSVFLQFGPIVLVYLGTYMYSHPMSYEGLYYSDIADVILSHKSWCLMNDVLLLYEIANLEKDGWGLLVGVDDTMTFVIDDKDATELSDAYRILLGPAAMWTITDSWGERLFEKPTVILQGHYYIEDPIADDAKRSVRLLLAFSVSTNWYR